MSEQRPATGDEASARIEAAEGLLDAHATMVVSACLDGAPWIARVFFVEDEPRQGSLDMCCALVAGTERREGLRTNPRVAFFVGGDEPDRWATGTGVLRVIGDEADGAAILKRLRDVSSAAAAFLDAADPQPIRINVERLTVTDLDAEPPVTEFSFA